MRRDKRKDKLRHIRQSENKIELRRLRKERKATTRSK